MGDGDEGGIAPSGAHQRHANGKMINFAHWDGDKWVRCTSGGGSAITPHVGVTIDLVDRPRRSARRDDDAIEIVAL